MAKLALLLVAAFCLVQLGMAANIQKRDTAAAGLGDVEITTQSIFDKIQAGIKNTFSEDNLNKAKEGATALGTQLKDAGGKFLTQSQTAIGNLFNKNDASTTTTAPAPAPAS